MVFGVADSESGLGVFLRSRPALPRRFPIAGSQQQRQDGFVGNIRTRRIFLDEIPGSSPRVPAHLSSIIRNIGGTRFPASCNVGWEFPFPSCCPLMRRDVRLESTGTQGVNVQKWDDFVAKGYHTCAHLSDNRTSHHFQTLINPHSTNSILNRTFVDRFWTLSKCTGRPAKNNNRIQ